jgi:N-acetylneuraminate synthase/N,N'-diacetyllegionaminate synthase
MLSALELGQDDFQILFDVCRDEGIRFLSSPFDQESAEFLLNLGLDTVKLGSGEVTNLPMLRWIGGRGARIILSTGMSDMDEVARAVLTLQEAGARELVLLHCVSEYPAPVDQLNLRAIRTMERAFGLPVGFSDHSGSNAVAAAAVALGARVIERHLTLDPTAPGPDHACSSSPEEFETMVSAIREVEQSLGDGLKRPAPCELANRAVVRKSLVAARDLPVGAVVREEDLAIKRPATGIAPAHLELILGLTLQKPVARDHVLQWADFQHDSP